MSRVAKPLPWAAELPQLQMGSSTQLSQDAPVQCMPPNLPASCASVGQQPLLPPPRWPHLFLGGPPPLPLLLPGAGKPALHPSELREATLPIQQAPYPKPLSWRLALTWPPGHLDHLPKFQPPQAKFLVAPAPIQAPILQWGVPPPRLHLCPPLLPPPAPPWASTTPTPALHPGLELTGIIHLPGVHWPCTPQRQPPPHTSARYALHNLGTSSLVCRPGTAQTWKQWGKGLLIPGGFTSQHPPAGRKVASELQ